MTSTIAPFAHIDIWSSNTRIADETEPTTAKSDLLMHSKIRVTLLVLGFAQFCKDESTESEQFLAIRVRGILSKEKPWQLTGTHDGNTSWLKRSVA